MPALLNFETKTLKPRTTSQIIQELKRYIKNQKSSFGEPLNATVLLFNPPLESLNSNSFTVLPKSRNADFPGISTASARVSKVGAFML